MGTNKTFSALPTALSTDPTDPDKAQNQPIVYMENKLIHLAFQDTVRVEYVHTLFTRQPSKDCFSPLLQFK